MLWFIPVILVILVIFPHFFRTSKKPEMKLMPFQKQTCLLK